LHALVRNMEVQFYNSYKKWEFMEESELQQNIRNLKYYIIGNCGIKCGYMSLKLSDIEDKLIDLLQKFSKNEELKLDIMAILCSLVKDEQYRCSKAEDDFATKLLMQEIETGSMRYVEYCLSYLRNRKVHLCKNEKALQGILRYIQISERIQYNMAAIFASACKDYNCKKVIVKSGALSYLLPLMFSFLPKFKVCGLKFVAALLYKSYGAAILLSGVSYNGVPLPVHLKECLSSGNVYIVQLYAAKCLIYFYRIKCLKDIRPFIIKKLIPTILQIISAPDNYVRKLLKAEACEALAYCIEDDPELQYMVHWNQLILQTFNQCNSLSFIKNKDVETIAAHIGSLKCISSIIGGNENIRRRVLGQIVDMDAYLLQMLTLEECPDDLKLAVYRCLLSMSRSVEQLRTVFHHCLICKALKDIVHAPNTKFVDVISSLLCNLVLEFSPLQSVILEYDFLATVCEWLHDDSHNLRLNAAWILMNMSYRADVDMKNSIVQALPPLNILYMLTEDKSEALVVSRLLGLLRNLLAEANFTDELMSNHGATIIEIFLEVLRGRFEECCKEQVLYALANTATGVEARKQLLKNDAIFEMISKFINHCNAELQIASVRCVHNLLMPRLGDVIGDAVLLDRILQKFNVVKHLKENKKEKTLVDVSCPAIVNEYNKYMGGVDLARMLRALYPIDHRSRKWYRRIFLDTPRGKALTKVNKAYARKSCGRASVTANTETSRRRVRRPEPTKLISSVLVQDKKGCKGGVTTNLDVAAVIRRTLHGDDCPVDEHTAYRMEKRAILKKAKEVRSAMYKQRVKRFPRLPRDRQDLVLADEFTRTKSGKAFLLTQSASKHILIFSTAGSIKLLAAMQTWGMDGTFKVVPYWYEQLFTIHAFAAGKLVPAVCCLCTDKDIGTNKFISQALISRAAVLEDDLNPDIIICDFETALIPAIQRYFPNAQVQGCYFYFCQAVHRKVGELGLKTRYRQHEETRRKIKMLLATAFLPVPHVNTGVILLEAGTTGPITTWKVGIIGSTKKRVLLTRNPAAGSIRQISSRYAEKQQRVMIYTRECTSGRRTSERFLEALMCLTLKPI
ncbi:Armadillo repeat-containing protein 8, partial [Trichinella patagoniensis]